MGYVIRVEEGRKFYRVLVANPEGKRTLGTPTALGTPRALKTPRPKLDVGFKIYFKGTELESLERIKP